MEAHKIALSVVIIMFATVIYDFSWRSKLRKCLKANNLPIHSATGTYSAKVDVQAAKNALQENRIAEPDELKQIISAIEKGPKVAILFIVIASTFVLASSWL